jgi:saccharopine dehydrogenase-like NADP-dependent oxidoreductase
MTKILILSGYGAVCRQAAAALTRHDPELDVAVAGRNPATAAPIPCTTALRVDASDADNLAALDDVDMVLMCAGLDSVRVARACLERGIHYLDVTARHRRRC